MRQTWKLATSVSVLLLVGLGPVMARAGDMRRRKKLIATGWDKPDTRRLRENLAVMEKRPFDGVVIVVEGKTGDGKACHLRRAFVSEEWKPSWFDACIADLKACKFKRFTDNFISVGANPGDVDWFDEPGWAHIVQHWRIAASIAKASGFRGILFDPEPYTPPHAQFTCAAQAQRGRHTPEEYFVQARRRGREVMQAVAGEYPNIVLFSYFLNSVNVRATGRADPRGLLANIGYGLLPAFLDGWLDAAPTTVTLVDGCESAYRYNSVNQYLEAALAIKGACQELVSPENRPKYRAHVQGSFGIYLDAYWNPKTSPWYVDGLGGPRVRRLRENVRTALRVADEYVWVYGEKFRWWPTPNPRVGRPSWPEALPGSGKALAFARDPVEYAREQIAAARQAAKLTNLAGNGEFASERAPHDGHAETWKQGRPPAGWHGWQEKTSKGTFTWDRRTGAARPGSARAAGVANGCFLQRVAAEPGEIYAVRAACRVQGKGRCWLRVRWQTPEGKWTAEVLDRVFLPHKPQDAWAEIFGVVDVPATAGKLVILLGVAGQAGPEEAAWFDDVGLYRIE